MAIVCMGGGVGGCILKKIIVFLLLQMVGGIGFVMWELSLLG